MVIFISVLFGLLNLLLTWFLNHKSSEVSSNERSKANKAVALMQQCLSAAHQSGFIAERGQQTPFRYDGWSWVYIAIGWLNWFMFHPVSWMFGGYCIARMLP